MATYTSSQSGNFSAASTWNNSGPPGDGDTFNVSSGHTVTIDSGITVPTNGYSDSNVYGILQSQSNTANTLRMNGRLTVQGGGTLHLRAKAKVQVKGTSSENHGIWIENAAGADLVMEGSDGMPSTTTTSAHAIHDSYITVSSASDFAVGEHIAIYDITTSYTGTDWWLPVEGFSDEGFWIHEISGSNIYVRHFVSPEATIEKTIGNDTVQVNNAKVFRKAQRVIFNTGSDRNFLKISSINYNKNRITFESNITNKSNQIGETIYLGGLEKAHVSGSKVRKVATMTSAESASTATTITVLDAAMFAAGDDIYIERVSEADGTTDHRGYWSSGHIDMRHTISSVSGNTLTLDAAVGYTVKENARVVRLTRDVICEAVATDGSDYPSLYMEHTGNWNRACVIKDVYFKNWGNGSGTTYTGVVLRGLNSHDDDNIDVTLTETIPNRKTGSWIEGIAIYIWPDDAHERDWGPLWLYDLRSGQVRNSIVLYGDEGLSTYYEPGYRIYNNITAGVDGYGMRLEGLDNQWEVAYNHTSRCNYGYRVYNPYSGIAKGFHSNSADAHQYGLNIVSLSWCPNMIYKCKFTGHRYGLNHEYSGGGALYTEFRSCSGFPQPFNDATTRGTSQDGQYRCNNQYQGAGTTGKIVEHNFEIDRTSIYGYRWEAFYDNDEDAWRWFRRYDSSDNPCFMDLVYVPANATLRFSAKIKLDPSFSGTYPYLSVVDVMSSSRGDHFLSTESAGDHRFTGIRLTNQFTSAAASDYEEKQLTYGPYEWPSYVMAGVHSSSSNAAEGFWIQDMTARLDGPYASKAQHDINRASSGSLVTVKQNFTERKTRIGGRLK